MNREQRKRRLHLKCELERLEIRWLMRAGVEAAMRPLEVTADHGETRVDALTDRLSARVGQWLNHHPLASSPVDLAAEKAQLRHFMPSNVESWGTLRVLAQLEARGDHQLDLLYQQISARFDRWAVRHPVQARLSGLTASPLQPVSLAGTTDPASSPVGSGVGASSTPPVRGVSPDGGPPPPNFSIGSFIYFQNCNCGSTANDLLSLKGEPGGGQSSDGGGGESGGVAGPGSPPPLAGLKSGPMDSDSSLVTGEYFQDYQLAAYQALGVFNGIDMQYSSLQADPYPVVTGYFTTAAGSNSSSITSITASMTVNGVSQGTAVTYDDVSLTDGETYLVQLQAVNVSSYATGIYSVNLTVTEYFSGGTNSSKSFASTLMVVNDAASPYGAGWTIGGLQHITLGTVGSTLMITNGSAQPEEFTSSDGVNYVGNASDVSTLLANSSTHLYTRTYPDGSVVVFNSGGQEISSADANGNTTSYAYVTSGAATGALKTITDPVGLTTTLSYDANGHLSTVLDPASRTTTYTIGSSTDNLTKIVDPTAAATQYGYNSAHEITTETNPDNAVATVVYDSFGRMSSENLFGGTGTISITPAQEVGLVAAGGTTPLELAPNDVGTVTNADNATTSVTFDSLGGITSETDGRGNTTTITRNSHDWPVSMTDSLGRTTSYAYDSEGNVTTITQADGTPAPILYNDTYGVPTHVVDFDGNVTTYTLGSGGNITQEKDPDGQSVSYTYNSAGQVLTATDPLGKTTTYGYNGLGQLASITVPGISFATIQYTYDSAGDVSAVSDEVGDTVSYSYDQMGRVLTSQDQVQALAGKDTAYVYDAAGNLISVTDAMGHTTTYAYNARNEVVSVTDPLSNVTSIGYDAEGNVTTVEDARGNTTTYVYDGDNDLVSITDPMNNKTTYVYDQDDEVINMINPNGGVTTYTYNNLGEESTVILPGQTAPTSYTYDENGNELSVTDQLGDKTVYTYNNMGQEATETVYPNGSTAETTTYAYDADGDLIAVTDGLSHTTSYAYDAMGDLISETDPTGGGTTTYGYDAAGRLTTLTDPDSNTTTWTYTHADEVATETNPLGFATTYVYDLVGNVTSVTDANVHTITYTYNADDEETAETWVNPGGGSPLNLVTISYDADGDVTQIKDAVTNYQYTYNADDEVSTFADNGTTGLPLVTLTYGYDGDGNETSVTDSKGGVVSYTYNALDELTNEKLSGTGITSAEAVTYAYDNAERLTGVTRYSNLAETTKVAATAYSYDHADRMTGIVDSNSTGATLVTYGYTYDAADRLSGEVRTWASGASSDTLTYSYTNNNQLTGVTHTNGAFSSESFTYDANGNETGAGFTTGTDNEQTASTGYTYTYDHAGELTSETQTSTGDIWTYSYDFRGRMVTAVEKTSGGTTLESVTFTYDALDNRIGMDENSTQVWTLYDGGNSVMDFNGAGSLTMRYLWGPTGIVARQTSGGTVSWYLADHLGTVRDLINNSGAIIDHVDFSAFGTVLGETSPTSGDRMMGFAGMERDTVSGLNLAVYRVENPGTGRWTSEDPLGFGGGDTDLYSYVADDPANLTDSSGLKFVRDGKVGAEAEELILQKLAKVLGTDIDALKPIKESSVWKIIAESEQLVRVGFENTLDTPKLAGKGGIFNRQKHTFRVGKDDCEGYDLWLDPRSYVTDSGKSYTRTPRDLLYNFVHELLHAALQLGGTITYEDKPIFDNWNNNPDNKPLGGGDLSLTGEQYAKNLAGKVKKLPVTQPDGAGLPDNH